MRLVFLDTETTGLDIEMHEVWEVGCIVRDYQIADNGNSLWPTADVEHHWYLPLYNFKNADPFALNIGKFWDRYKWPDAKAYDDMAEWCRMWTQLTKDAFIIGACVDFDAYRLDKLCKVFGYRMFHNYHLIDVENLCAGHLHFPPPWKSEVIYEAMGYKPVEEDKHTALGDARACRDIYDLIMNNASQD